MIRSFVKLAYSLIKPIKIVFKWLMMGGEVYLSVIEKKMGVIRLYFVKLIDFSQNGDF